MKLVRSARSIGTIIKRIIKCRACNAEMEVTSNDLKELTLISDWRDGDYYEVACLEPGCNYINNVAASLFS